MNFLPHENAQKKLNTTGGFTLLEMLVSTSLYVVSMLIIVSALISLESASRKARTIRIATDNVSAAMDSMSRTIRMGSYFHCGCTGAHAALAVPAECEMSNTGVGGLTCLSFESQGGDPLTPDDQYVYKLSGQRILRSVDSGDNWLYLTAPEISITELHFYVGGVALDDKQPYVTIVLRGVATSSSIRANTTFNIQTTVSARTPNFLLSP